MTTPTPPAVSPLWLLRIAAAAVAAGVGLVAAMFAHTGYLLASMALDAAGVASTPTAALVAAATVAAALVAHSRANAWLVGHTTPATIAGLWRGGTLPVGGAVARWHHDLATPTPRP